MIARCGLFCIFAAVFFKRALYGILVYFFQREERGFK